MKLTIFVLIVLVFFTIVFNRKKIKYRLQEKQDNQRDYDLGLQAFRKGDYKTALFFFSEICKKKGGKLFRDSYEMRKKSEKALKAQYKEKRRKDYKEIIDLYHNGQFEKALYRLEHESFLLNPLPDTGAVYEDCRSKLYDSGIQAMQKEDYETAKSVFLIITGYKDSSAKIEICNEHITPKSET